MATHTEKYLSLNSHHPKQSKVAVVKTLLDRAAAIPLNASRKKSEKDRDSRRFKNNRVILHYYVGDSKAEGRRSQDGQKTQTWNSTYDRVDRR